MSTRFSEGLDLEAAFSRSALKLEKKLTLLEFLDANQRSNLAKVRLQLNAYSTALFLPDLSADNFSLDQKSLSRISEAIIQMSLEDLSRLGKQGMQEDSMKEKLKLSLLNEKGVIPHGKASSDREIALQESSQRSMIRSDRVGVVSRGRGGFSTRNTGESTDLSSDFNNMSLTARSLLADLVTSRLHPEGIERHGDCHCLERHLSGVEANPLALHPSKWPYILRKSTYPFIEDLKDNVNLDLSAQMHYASFRECSCGRMKEGSRSVGVLNIGRAVSRSPGSMDKQRRVGSELLGRLQSQRDDKEDIKTFEEQKSHLEVSGSVDGTEEKAEVEKSVEVKRRPDMSRLEALSKPRSVSPNIKGKETEKKELGVVKRKEVMSTDQNQRLSVTTKVGLAKAEQKTNQSALPSKSEVVKSKSQPIRAEHVTQNRKKSVSPPMVTPQRRSSQVELDQLDETPAKQAEKEPKRASRSAVKQFGLKETGSNSPNQIKKDQERSKESKTPTKSATGTFSKASRPTELSPVSGKSQVKVKKSLQIVETKDLVKEQEAPSPCFGGSLKSNNLSNNSPKPNQPKPTPKKIEKSIKKASPEPVIKKAPLRKSLSSSTRQETPADEAQQLQNEEEELKQPIEDQVQAPVLEKAKPVETKKEEEEHKLNQQVQEELPPGLHMETLLAELMGDSFAKYQEPWNYPTDRNSIEEQVEVTPHAVDSHNRLSTELFSLKRLYSGVSEDQAIVETAEQRERRFLTRERSEMMQAPRHAMRSKSSFDFGFKSEASVSQERSLSASKVPSQTDSPLTPARQDSQESPTLRRAQDSRSGHTEMAVRAETDRMSIKTETVKESLIEESFDPTSTGNNNEFEFEKKQNLVVKDQAWVRKSHQHASKSDQNQNDIKKSHHKEKAEHKDQKLSVPALQQSEQDNRSLSNNTKNSSEVHNVEVSTREPEERVLKGDSQKAGVTDNYELADKVRNEVDLKNFSQEDLLEGIENDQDNINFKEIPSDDQVSVSKEEIERSKSQENLEKVDAVANGERLVPDKNLSMAKEGTKQDLKVKMSTVKNKGSGAAEETKVLKDNISASNIESGRSASPLGTKLATPSVSAARKSVTTPKKAVNSQGSDANPLAEVIQADPKQKLEKKTVFPVRKTNDAQQKNAKNPIKAPARTKTPPKSQAEPLKILNNAESQKEPPNTVISPPQETPGAMSHEAKRLSQASLSLNKDNFLNLQPLEVLSQHKNPPDTQNIYSIAISDITNTSVPILTPGAPEFSSSSLNKSKYSIPSSQPTIPESKQVVPQRVKPIVPLIPTHMIKPNLPEESHANSNSASILKTEPATFEKEFSLVLHSKNSEDSSFEESKREHLDFPEFSHIENADVTHEESHTWYQELSEELQRTPVSNFYSETITQDLSNPKKLFTSEIMRDIERGIEMEVPADKSAQTDKASRFNHSYHTDKSGLTDKSELLKGLHLHSLNKSPRGEVSAEEGSYNTNSMFKRGSVSEISRRVSIPLEEIKKEEGKVEIAGAGKGDNGVGDNLVETSGEITQFSAEKEALEGVKDEPNGKSKTSRQTSEQPIEVRGVSVTSEKGQRVVIQPGRSIESSKRTVSSSSSPESGGSKRQKDNSVSQSKISTIPKLESTENTEKAADKIQLTPKLTNEESKIDRQKSGAVIDAVKQTEAENKSEKKVKPTTLVKGLPKNKDIEEELQLELDGSLKIETPKRIACVLTNSPPKQSSRRQSEQKNEYIEKETSSTLSVQGPKTASSSKSPRNSRQRGSISLLQVALEPLISTLVPNENIGEAKDVATLPFMGTYENKNPKTPVFVGLKEGFSVITTTLESTEKNPSDKSDSTLKDSKEQPTIHMVNKNLQPEAQEHIPAKDSEPKSPSQDHPKALKSPQRNPKTVPAHNNLPTYPKDSSKSAPKPLAVGPASQLEEVGSAENRIEIHHKQILPCSSLPSTKAAQSKILKETQTQTVNPSSLSKSTATNQASSADISVQTTRIKLDNKNTQTLPLPIENHNTMIQPTNNTSFESHNTAAQQSNHYIDPIPTDHHSATTNDNSFTLLDHLLKRARAKYHQQEQVENSLIGFVSRSNYSSRCSTPRSNNTRVLYQPIEYDFEWDESHSNNLRRSATPDSFSSRKTPAQHEMPFSFTGLNSQVNKNNYVLNPASSYQNNPYQNQNDPFEASSPRFPTIQPLQPARVQPKISKPTARSSLERTLAFTREYFSKESSNQLIPLRNTILEPTPSYKISSNIPRFA